MHALLLPVLLLDDVLMEFVPPQHVLLLHALTDDASTEFVPTHAPVLRALTDNVLTEFVSTDVLLPHALTDDVSTMFVPMDVLMLPALMDDVSTELVSTIITLGTGIWSGTMEKRSHSRSQTTMHHVL